MNPLKVQQNSFKNESWTDDLPVCKNTGIGFSINQIYRKDGHPQEDHPYEDDSSHFCFSKDLYWYAVFDGHEGKRAADFCSQRMAAEICFSQINNKQSDEEVRELIRQAFSTVETGYMETLGDILAERTSLQYDIPDGMSMYEAYKTVSIECSCQTQFDQKECFSLFSSRLGKFEIFKAPQTEALLSNYWLSLPTTDF